MSQATADIFGTKGAGFTITIDAATILSAYLEVPNQPLVSLAIAGSNREVTVPSLPVGQSWVRLDLVWAPGDPDATINLGTVTTGTVNAAAAKGTITDGNTPGYVELWGA
jgi:hypothetical protein